jgi:hypothetical protein
MEISRLARLRPQSFAARVTNNPYWSSSVARFARERKGIFFPSGFGKFWQTRAVVRIHIFGLRQSLVSNDVRCS